MNKFQGETKKLAITIDFENFSHDLGRSLGIVNQIRCRQDALLRSYEFFMALMNKNFKNTKATFFCTGVLAEKNPEIIKKISMDGHEIACHYYYHDDLNKASISDARNKLDRAKKILQDVSGQEILGFRAPRFSLKLQDEAHWALITQMFRYDSSLHVSEHLEFKSCMSRFNLDGFTEFPVAKQKVVPFLPKFKIGGSYLKLFPADLVKKAVAKTAEGQLLPIVYLHPYDLLPSAEFGLSYSELKGLGITKKIHTLLRQMQWTRIGNSQMLKKIRTITDGYSNVGPLNTLL